MQTATIEQLLSQHDLLKQVSDSPLLDCQILMSFVLDKPREWLYAHSEHNPSEKELDRYRDLVSRRLSGEPIAYITGTKEFWNRSFKVSKDTLVPRPETELLVETILKRFGREPMTVLDLGTGTGAVAVCLAEERPDWTVIGAEINSDAINVARHNGEGLKNLSWLAAHWCDSVARGSVDVIVSNPPYVCAGDPHLVRLEHEPINALVSGPDGLDDIRHITHHGYDCLTNDGWIVIEHGFDQDDSVRDMLQARGFTNIETLDDLSGRPRVSLGQRNPV